MHGIIVLVITALIFFYSHYGFASLNGHITAMYPAFIAVAVAAGAPPYVTALALGYAGCLCMTLTHYASGPSPIYFGAGYVEQADWWRLGFMVSVVNVVIWGVGGGIWWKVLGLW